jgi:murein L,D-transpeptidase YcbB/YkuD
MNMRFSQSHETAASAPSDAVGYVRTPWRLIRQTVVLGLLACTTSVPGPVPIVATAADGRDEARVQRPVSDFGAAIRSAVENGDPRLPPLTRTEREELASLYRTGEFGALWVTASGRPTPDAGAALGLLSGAPAEGLDAAEYSASMLSAWSTRLASGPGPAVSDAAAFDAGLSGSMLRYLRQLHMGRVDPRAIGFHMSAPADEHDFGAVLRSALGAHRLTQTAAEWAPPLTLYRRLRDTLARYRTLAADPAVEDLPPIGAPVRPGQPYPGLGALQRRLVAVGDLPPGVQVSAETSVYEGALVEGVRHFQIRHGLEADGVLGVATQAALRVPLAWRVRQLELALERLRWLPHLSPDRFLAVNIPMFHLWVWDSIPPNGAPAFEMGVIVGRALNTRTPVFEEEMRFIIFRPYWNIPPSILRSEILPALRRDPGYLAQHDMEVVSGQGDDARAVGLSGETMALLQQGRLRVRQRPGPKNALGLVKFVFPNDENIYLHGTPTPQLFSRTRRDFSHGCVRVADPAGLAEWALRGQDDWTRERVVAAMNADRSTRVNLARPIQVIMFYVTAVVMPEDGTIRFAEDIYGHDATLDRALTRRQSDN